MRIGLSKNSSVFGVDALGETAVPEGKNRLKKNQQVL
jgi:hypothetical protein